MATNNVLVNEIYDHFLVCKICLEGYKGPKTLSCQHTFCKDCLVKHHDSEQQRPHGYRFLSRSVSCPVCHKRTDLPIGGIQKLSDNFLVSNLYDVVERRRQQQGGGGGGQAKVAPGSGGQCDICRPTTMTTGARTRSENRAYYRCLDCSKTLCRRCADLHRRTNVTRDHGLFDVGVRERDVQCRVHREETIRFFCEPCGECICVLCTFQDQHKDHEVFTFTEGLERHARSFDGLLERGRGRCRRLREEIEVIARCEANAKTTEEYVREFAMDLVRQVRRQEREILRELKEVFGSGGKAREFLQQKSALQETLHTLENTCSLTEIVVKDRGVELLMLKKEINQKLDKLLAEDRFLVSPDFLARSVVFVPGNCFLGELNFEDEHCEENSTGHHGTKTKRTEHGSSSSSRSFDPGSPRFVSDCGGRQEVKDFEDDEPFSSNAEERDKTDRRQTGERCSAEILSREALKRTNGRTRIMHQDEATAETVQSSEKPQFPNGECKCSNKRKSNAFVDRSTMTTSTIFDGKCDKVLDTEGLICTENHFTQSTLTEVRSIETATDAALTISKATATIASEYLDKSVATESSYFLGTVADAAPDAVTTTDRVTRTESDHTEEDSAERPKTTRVKHCSSYNTAASPKKSKSTRDAPTTACHGYEVLRRQTRISLSRGTATERVQTVERGTSPDAPSVGVTERGSSPIRFSVVDKAVSVSSGEIAEPVDTFQTSGGKHQKLLSSSGPRLDVICEDSEEPSSSSDEEQDGLPPSGPLTIRQRFAARGLSSSCEQNRNGGVLTHREKFAPSFGSRLRGGPQASSIFSVEGRKSASSILWKVETGTNTSLVDLHDKAVGTDSPLVDTKMAECISKLKTVRQRLETTQTANASTSTSGSKESPEMTTSTSSFESTERRPPPPHPSTPRSPRLEARRNQMTLSFDPPQTHPSPRRQRHRTAYARPVVDSSPSESSDPDQTSPGMTPPATTTSQPRGLLPSTARRPPAAIARKQRTAVGEAQRVSPAAAAAKTRSPRIIRKQLQETSSQNNT